MLHSCMGGRKGEEDVGLGRSRTPERADTSGCPPPSSWLILGVYVHLSVGMIVTWSPQAWHVGHM